MKQTKGNEGNGALMLLCGARKTACWVSSIRLRCFRRGDKLNGSTVPSGFVDAKLMDVVPKGVRIVHSDDAFSVQFAEMLSRQIRIEFGCRCLLTRAKGVGNGIRSDASSTCLGVRGEKDRADLENIQVFGVTHDAPHSTR